MGGEGHRRGVIAGDEPAQDVAADWSAGIGALPAGLGREALIAAVGVALDATVAHGATVVLALSGGPDSTALAHLVVEARPDLRPVVGHVRHGLRDDAADAAAAADHAAALGLAYHERRVSVRRDGEGLEAAARRARYRALVRIAADAGAEAVLVGHSADDQAETVLLNLARGSGVRGLAGMAPARQERRGGRRVRVVRPLLRVRRRDLRAFIAGEGLAAVSDPTNTDRELRRARARYDVLPALAGLSGGAGDPVGALSRLADLARDDADALDALADRHARRLLVRWGPVRAVRAEELAALPRALATRVVLRLLAAVRGRSDGLGAQPVADVLALAPGQSVHVAGGVWVTAGGGWLAAVPPDAPALPERRLAVPGRTPLPEVGVVVCADDADGDVHGQARLALPGAAPARRPPPGPFADLPPRAPVDADAPAPSRWVELPAGTGPYVVRARAAGDMVRLPGGRRKLSDVLVDAGVPRAARALVPIIARESGEVLWIPGIAVAVDDSPAPGRLPGPRVWLGRRSGADDVG